MQNVQTNEYEVAVEPGRVLVSMNPREVEKAPSAAAFATRHLAEGAITKPNGVAFYGALNEDVELVRTVSMAIADRAAVAALVAGWIAEGLEVTKLSIKDLVKYARAIEKREKDEALLAKAQAEAAQAEASQEPAAESSGETPSAEAQAAQAIATAAAHSSENAAEASSAATDIASLLGSDEPSSASALPIE